MSPIIKIKSGEVCPLCRVSCVLDLSRWSHYIHTDYSFIEVGENPIVCKGCNIKEWKYRRQALFDMIGVVNSLCPDTPAWA